MRAGLQRLWDHVWFRPEGPLSLLAARAIVCLQALWILLSRPDLPDLVAWPREFWLFVDRFLPLRFGFVGLPLAFERLLFLTLHVALLAALAGVWPRVSCALAAVLLYHFAPLEEIVMGMPHTSFGGLTVPALALFILSFAEIPRRGRPPSPEHRWPLALIQLLFAFSYLFPALAKLRYSGPAWFTADNIRSWMIVNHAITWAPWARRVASSQAWCGAIAAGTLGLELSFLLAVVSRRAAAFLVPLAFVFHLGTIGTLGYFFPSLPLLLMYVDWDRVATVAAGGRRWSGARTGATAAGAGAPR